MLSTTSETISSDESRLARLISLTARQLLSPPPDRNADAWAAQERSLPQGSPIPGRWRPETAPYLTDVAQAFCDLQYSTVVLCCASQQGKTELVGNLLGWTVTDRPRSCLYIGPTQDQVRELSRDRIDKMIRTTKVLRDRLDPRATHQSVYERWFAGAKMSFAWAGSATQLASRPAALALVDERDRMGSDVAGEGDPVALADARVKNFHNSKIGIFSTPTVLGESPTWSWFLSGTMHRWAWLCVHCSEWFVPTLELLVYDPDPDIAHESARVACEHCGAEYDDRGRRALEGRYIPHDHTDDGRFVPREAARQTKVASFWVSGLASPFTSIGDVAQRKALAEQSQEVGRIQAVVNTWGGEPFELTGETPGHQAVLDKRRDYHEPAGVRLVTFGADVQADCIWYVVRGWGVNAESWLLQWGRVMGDTAHDSVWIALGTITAKHYCGLPIRLGLVDSGWNTEAVYKFCRRLPNVKPSKGHATLDKPFKDALVDERPSGKVIKSGVQLWHVNTDYWKSWLYGRIRWPAGEPGDWHVNSSIDESYAKQVTNEQLIVIDGRRKWIRTGTRENHLMDCETLSACAAHILNVQELREIPAGPPAPPPSKPRIDPGFRRRTL